MNSKEIVKRINIKKKELKKLQLLLSNLESKKTKRMMYFVQKDKPVIFGKTSEFGYEKKLPSFFPVNKPVVFGETSQFGFKPLLQNPIW